MTVAVPVLAQSGGPAPPALPKDPRALLAAAAPYYDFSNPVLKPWYLKANYQLYDDNGNPSQQGTFEYWWASPTVYRTTWMRGSTSVHTDWHTADGRHFYEEKGDKLDYFERKLQSALLAPLPSDKDLKPGASRLDGQELKLGSVKVPCVVVVPPMPPDPQNQTFPLGQSIPIGVFPTYCFDTKLPALLASFAMGNVTIVFNQITKAQDRFLARNISFLEAKRLIMTAHVAEISGVSPANPAFTPDSNAIELRMEKMSVSAGVAVGHLIKKEFPVYPQDAKDARVSGTVVLEATIGCDGAVHDLRVVSAPWPSLAASALWSVSHWEYRPYLLNGQPVEVETTINVIYSLR